MRGPKVSRDGFEVSGSGVGGSWWSMGARMNLPVLVVLVPPTMSMSACADVTLAREGRGFGVVGVHDNRAAAVHHGDAAAAGNLESSLPAGSSTRRPRLSLTVAELVTVMSSTPSWLIVVVMVYVPPLV